MIYVQWFLIAYSALGLLRFMVFVWVVKEKLRLGNDDRYLKAVAAWRNDCHRVGQPLADIILGICCIFYIALWPFAPMIFPVPKK